MMKVDDDDSPALPMRMPSGGRGGGGGGGGEGREGVSGSGFSIRILESDDKSVESIN